MYTRPYLFCNILVGIKSPIVIFLTDKDGDQGDIEVRLNQIPTVMSLTRNSPTLCQIKKSSTNSLHVSWGKWHYFHIRVHPYAFYILRPNFNDGIEISFHPSLRLPEAPGTRYLGQTMGITSSWWDFRVFITSSSFLFQVDMHVQ